MLWHLGERQAAIAHLQDMLRLNPGDNQGLRYTLANWLLAVGDDAAVEQLLAQYPDEGSAQWAYTKALHAFRRLGAGKQADKALQEALEVNPHVPAYLLGVKKLPKQLPAYIGMRDENEAVWYAAQAVEPWVATPGALEWFAAVLTRRAAPSPSPRPGRARRKWVGCGGLDGRGAMARIGYGAHRSCAPP